MTWPMDPLAILSDMLYVFLWSAGGFVAVVILGGILIELFRPDDD